MEEKIRQNELVQRMIEKGKIKDASFVVNFWNKFQKNGDLSETEFLDALHTMTDHYTAYPTQQFDGVFEKAVAQKKQDEEKKKAEEAKTRKGDAEKQEEKNQFCKKVIECSSSHGGKRNLRRKSVHKQNNKRVQPSRNNKRKSKSRRSRRRQRKSRR